jgi:hypothetical protein
LNDFGHVKDEYKVPVLKIIPILEV